MFSKLANSLQNNKMVHPNSGWTLSIGFEFTAIDDDTAVYAVCRHFRGFFSLGLFFGLLLSSFFAVQHGATVHFVVRCVCDTSPL